MFRKCLFCALSLIFCLISAYPSAVAQQSASAVSPAMEKEKAKEVWTNLSVDPSWLTADTAKYMLLGTYDGPTYTRELLRVEWRAGDPIDLYVVKPKGVVKPRVALYLYDYRWDSDRFRNDAWCKQTTERGVAAVGFVTLLSGQRLHAPRPMKQWIVSQLQEVLGVTTHDVQMVLHYLDSRGDLNTDRVGMFGEGSGAAIAVLAATAEKRIVALQLLNPWGDWPEWLKESKQIPEEERGDYLKPEFLAGVSMLDPIGYLPKLADRSISILQVESELVTLPTIQAKIAAAAPPSAQLKRFKDMEAFGSAARSRQFDAWLPDHIQPEAEMVRNGKEVAFPH